MYLVPVKCYVFAVVIRKSSQEEVTHKGETVLQAVNWWKDVQGQESPTGKGTESWHPCRCTKGFKGREARVEAREEEKVRSICFFLPWLVRNDLGRKKFRGSSNQITVCEGGWEVGELLF